jgi:hypothetical protein
LAEEKKPKSIQSARVSGRSSELESSIQPFSSEQFINPTPPSLFTVGAKLMYTQNKELKIQNTEYRKPNSEYRIQIAKIIKRFVKQSSSW